MFHHFEELDTDFAELLRRVILRVREDHPGDVHFSIPHLAQYVERAQRSAGKVIGFDSWLPFAELRGRHLSTCGHLATSFFSDEQVEARVLTK